MLPLPFTDAQDMIPRSGHMACHKHVLGTTRTKPYRLPTRFTSLHSKLSQDVRMSILLRAVVSDGQQYHTFTLAQEYQS